MNHRKLLLLLALSALRNDGLHAQAQVPDLLSHMTGFSSGRTNHIPRGVSLLFEDPTTKSIANRCVGGASLKHLNTTGIDCLEQRLSRLVDAGALVLREGRYFLPCPVIVGEKRELMDRITKERVAEILPRIEPMIYRLKQALKDRPQFLFHIFWSRVVDQTFWMLWEEEFPHDVGPPATTWLIYPDHPCQVGTNYNSAPGNSEIAISWSFNCSEHLTPIMRGRFDLYSSGSGVRTPDSLSVSLQEFGCMDETLNPHIFYYQKDDSVDHLIQELKRDFVAALHGLYDYRTLSRTFDIPYDDLYVILVHETAYAIFQNLDETGKLAFPSVLKEGNPRQECYRLVSMAMGTPSMTRYLLLGAAGAVVGVILWQVLRWSKMP